MGSMLHLKGKVWKRCYHSCACPYVQVRSRAEIALLGGGTVERVDRSIKKFMNVSAIEKGKFTSKSAGGYVRQYEIQVVPVKRR